MATKLSVGIIVTCVLTIMLQVFHINAQDRFYKVSLVWPTSLCSISEVSCERPIRGKFFIGAVQPMDVNGIVLRRYDPDSPCTDTRPMSQDSLTEDWFRNENILENMITSWPYIENYSNLTANIIHWKSLWMRYGMCFKNSDKGYLDYFGAGLRVASSINLYEILKRGGITRNPYAAYLSSYFVSVLESVGKNVQINCYTTIENGEDGENREKLYFGGIALCYGNDDTLIDCPNQFYGCPDPILRRQLHFP